MYCDAVRCKNCRCFFVFRASKPALPPTDQDSSETETESVAVACHECKHVYQYSEWQSVPTLWGESVGPVKTPTVFRVPLLCDEEDCQLPLQVVVPRAADTTKADIEAELPSWTLHDLKCPNDHPIAKIHN